MNTHQGAKLSKLIRQGKYSMAWIAEKLKMSRTTLYNRLKKPNLSIDFLLSVSKVLQCDLTKDFPEVTKAYVTSNYLHEIKDDYIKLLESHHSVLLLIFKILYNIVNPNIKRQVEKQVYDILIEEGKFDPLVLLSVLRKTTSALELEEA